jgi:hypothetical protein
VLPKIEYDQLYKFVVSLGVLLAATAIALPLLLLRASADLRVPRDELDRLTPTARQVITTKQRSLEVTLYLIPVASPVLLVSGGLTSWYGLRRWKRRQDEDDEQQRLDTRLKRREVEAMTPGEIAAKEAAEAEATDATARPRDERASWTDRQSGFLQDYRDAEKLLVAKLVEAFGAEYEVRANVRVGNIDVDVLLEPRRPDLRSVAVELKVLHGRTGARNARNRVEELAGKRARLVERGVTDAFVGLLVLTDDTEPTHRERVDSLIHQAEVATILLTVSELAAIDRDTMLDRFREAIAADIARRR